MKLFFNRAFLQFAGRVFKSDNPPSSEHLFTIQLSSLSLLLFKSISCQRISMASLYSAAPPLTTRLARFQSRCPVTKRFLGDTCSSSAGSARILHSLRLQDVLGKRLVTYCSKIPSPAISQVSRRQTIGDIDAYEAALSGQLCPVILSEKRLSGRLSDLPSGL